MSTIALSPRSGGRSGTGNTYRRTIELSAPAERPTVAVSFRIEPSPVYSAARSAIRPKAKEAALKSRLKKWSDREYRRGYLEASIEQGIAWQIRTNRQVRGLSQADLAELISTHQSAISRLEDPAYGAHSIDTLVSIANAFDCALAVRFIPYSELARLSEDLAPEALLVEPFSVEVAALEQMNEH